MKALLNMLNMLLIVGIGCGCGSYPAGDYALKSLNSSDQTTVSIERKWISFTPTEPLFTTGIVFYPGGKVEAESYAPILRNLADKGVSTYIVYVPQDLAILNQDAAESIFDTDTRDQWLVAGHSLGGVAAAKMALEYSRVKGLSLWASYPAGSVDLSEQSVSVHSIAGSKDEVIDWENWENSAAQLPDTTEWITIEGGNHAQFGDYGEQDGDGTPEISAEEQLNQTEQAMIALLEDIETTSN